MDKASGKWSVKERWEVAVGDFVKVGFVTLVLLVPAFSSVLLWGEGVVFP